MLQFLVRLSFFFLIINLQLFASKGIVVACNDYYSGFFLPSLAYLRLEQKSELPIEIWYSGDELSQKNKDLLSRFGNVTFHDVVDVFGGEAKDYWGFQIKAYMLKGSNFDEVMIADADVYFAQDPIKLFSNPDYIKTGALFFRDHPIKGFSGLEDNTGESEKGCSYWKYGFIECYFKRREYFRRLIDSPSQYIPQDMTFFWEEANPTIENPFLIHYQEAGVVVIDKDRHRRGVEEIFTLNKNHKETYLYVHGDKETFWLGMEIAKEPYSFNLELPKKIKGKWIIYGIIRQKIRLAHLIGGELFWFQKKPIPLGNKPIYKSYNGEEVNLISEKDIDSLEKIRFYVNMFGMGKDKFD